ncbi:MULTISPECIES: MarR family transcriptional regulator [Enterobacteriaceae]|uniref:MarR family transcriptional regulator n=1 Tax=Enterobacteriaceae TaxID=543 RepID=UPI0018E553C1|nr:MULTISPECIES: helix-turn-helix domain-containing protein [Enterobacteriaceae]
MAQRRLGQIDMSTGEVLEDGFVAYIAPKRKNGFGTRWMAMAQDAAMMFAQSDLGADDFRVLMSLMAKLDFENLLVLNQAEMARELKMQRQNVQRSVKRLIGMGALLEGPRIGISRSYRFNPQFGWKGSARNHVIALDQERKRRMAAAGISGVIDGGTKEAEAPAERDPNTLDMFEDLPR